MYMYVLVTCTCTCMYLLHVHVCTCYMYCTICHQVLHEEDEKKRVHQMEQQRQSV